MKGTPLWIRKCGDEYRVALPKEVEQSKIQGICKDPDSLAIPNVSSAILSLAFMRTLTYRLPASLITYASALRSIVCSRLIP